MAVSRRSAGALNATTNRADGPTAPGPPSPQSCHAALLPRGWDAARNDASGWRRHEMTPSAWQSCAQRNTSPFLTPLHRLHRAKAYRAWRLCGCWPTLSMALTRLVMAPATWLSHSVWQQPQLPRCLLYSAHRLPTDHWRRYAVARDCCATGHSSSAACRAAALRSTSCSTAARGSAAHMCPVQTTSQPHLASTSAPQLASQSGTLGPHRGRCRPCHAPPPACDLYQTWEHMANPYQTWGHPGWHQWSYAVSAARHTHPPLCHRSSTWKPRACASARVWVRQGWLVMHLNRHFRRLSRCRLWGGASPLKPLHGLLVRVVPSPHHHCLSRGGRRCHYATLLASLKSRRCVCTLMRPFAPMTRAGPTPQSHCLTITRSHAI